MIPSATNWQEVALAKLTRVMGPVTGRQLASSVLAELKLQTLSTPGELRTFATALSTRGGFASAVAALLTLHAAMYEGSEQKSA